MIKILSVLLIAGTQPQSLSGFWVAPKHPELQLGIAEQGKSLKIVTVVSNKYGKRFYTTFHGKVQRKGKRISFSVSSKVMAVSKCTVEFTIMGHGQISPGNPRKFKMRGALISYMECDGSKGKMEVDDISDTWLHYVKPKSKIFI